MKYIYAFLLLTFTTFGAYAQSSWQSCELSPYVMVNDITVKNGHLFVATNDGVYMNKSTLVESYDWKKISAGLPDKPIISIAFSIMNRIIVTTGADVYYTDDDGANWTKYDNDLLGLNFRKFTTDYETDVYAATDNGVYKSTDHGASWDLFGLEGSGVLSVGVELNQHDIYAGTVIQNKSGVFKSTDLGATWVQVWNQTMSTNIIDPTPFGLVAGCYSQDTEDPSIRISTDGGQTWADGGLSNCSVSSLVYASNTTLFADIETKTILEGTQTYHGVQLSNDGGVNWKDWNDGLGDLDIHTLYYVNETLLAGTTAGLYFRAVNAETAVNELSTNNSGELIISPNPVVSGSEFQISSPLTGDCTISVYNLQGMCVYSLNQNFSGACKINSANLSTGFYTVIQSNGSSTMRAKMVVVE